MTEINWERLREAWTQDEIRRGNDVQLSLLTSDGEPAMLCERLSLDGETCPESFQLHRQRQGGEGERL